LHAIIFSPRFSGGTAINATLDTRCRWLRAPPFHWISFHGFAGAILNTVFVVIALNDTCGFHTSCVVHCALRLIVSFQRALSLEKHFFLFLHKEKKRTVFNYSSQVF
jgi:hypothetical protein